ncbi:MAG: hypothetical protein U0V56_06480 [Actinomycetota bacterium]
MEGVRTSAVPPSWCSEGDPPGGLRFVLEEGFDVVGEATTTVQLVQVLAVHRPDVVVLDDGIGTTVTSLSPARCIRRRR